MKETDEVHYNLPSIDWKTQYLTFKALSDSTFKLSSNSVSYSTDFGETWTTLARNTYSPTVKKDEYIMWKGELTPSSPNGVGRFSSTGNYEAMGNPYSLLYGDNFREVNDLSGTVGILASLFQNSYNLVSAKNLSLPATILGESCYDGMFYGCTSLTESPGLPATTLANACYRYMFQKCSGLTTPPELPSEIIAVRAYFGMFSGCLSLTTAPELRATSLDEYCYGSMFSGCTSLMTAPDLPATTLISGCYTKMFYYCRSLNYIKAMFTTTPSTTYTENWVNGVASTGTFVKNGAASWTTTGVNGIPNGWTVETASA